MNSRAFALITLCGGLWALTILVCGGRWTSDPVYAYGWFVPLLCLGFAWRRLHIWINAPEASIQANPPANLQRWSLAIAIAAGTLVPFEILRRDFFFNRMDTWILAIASIGFTLLAAGWTGGKGFRRALTIPLLFFLSAMPWPYRWESQITISLMTLVSDVTAELLRVGGVAAVAHGTVINLQGGPVGVTEACSGVKSLQASLMIGLAVGELFLLPTIRRVGLVGAALGLAMITNLIRTLALCLIVEHLGPEGFHRYHDTVGDAILFVLPITIWLVGKFLDQSGSGPSDEATTAEPAPAQSDAATPPPTPAPARLQPALRQLLQTDWQRLPDFRPAAVIAALAFLGVQAWAIALDYVDPPHATPLFALNPQSSLTFETQPLAPEIQEKLHPTQADSITITSPDFPDGKAVGYHFFWAPQPENRYTSSHRPDICMPAAGWKLTGAVKKIVDAESPAKTTWYLFDFEADGVRAMQLWGIWGNGRPLPIDFPGNLGARAPQANWSGIPGKHRPSVEVVSCVMNYRGGEPPVGQAMKLLREAFVYRGELSPKISPAGPPPAGRNP